MTTRRVDPVPISRLRLELEPLLAAGGFQPLAPKSEWTGKYNIFTWVRRTWKEDALRLGWRKSPVAHYFLDAQWSVPRTGRGALVAAGLDAGYGRRGLRDGHLPNRFPLFTATLEDRWCKEVVADAAFALAWLDRCSTREGALEELRRVDRNGPAAGTEAYAHIEQYLRAHAE